MPTKLDPPAPVPPRAPVPSPPEPSTPNLRWRGLTPQLLLWIILPLTALLLAVPFGSLALHGQAMRQLVAERDARAARAAASAVSEELRHRAASVQALAVHTSASDSPGLGGYSFLLDDFDGGLALFADDGQLLAASDGESEWEGRPVAEVIGTAGPRFSKPYANASGGGTMMLAGAAAPGGASAVGAFSLADLIRDAASAQGRASTFVVDPEGLVLYRSGVRQPEGELGRHPGVAEALRGEAGSTYLDAGGDEHVVAYAPIPPLGWALVLEEPWEAVDSPILRQTQVAPLVLVPVVAFALIVLWLGIRQIVQPLQALERRAAELAWGRYEAIEAPVGGIGEIRRLQAELVHMARKIRAAQQSLRDYVGAVSAGQEDERRRLARELHDGTIQSLIALNQRLQLARSNLGAHAVAGALEEVQRMSAQTIEDVRRFVRDLRPIYLEDLGLVPALDMLARDVQERTGIPIDFDSAGPERRLPAEVELTLYRMAQEALSNVARHACASRAWVRLGFSPAEVTLTVRDEGRGFVVPDSPAEFAPRGHFGLLGLHERSELIGARLAIRSTPDAGTAVEVRLPLQA